MPKKRSSRSTLITTAIVVTVLGLLASALIYLVRTDRGGGRKAFVAKIDLVKPNATPDKPPPPPKETPQPEETKKVETMVAPQDMAQAAGPKGDNKPAAEGPLGVAGEGGAGGDSFGLVGRGKGGRDITTLGTGGGARVGGDQGTILRRYAGYFHLVQEEMKKVAFKRLDDDHLFPKGKLEATVQIVMDESGVITECRIVRSSGNAKIDEAVTASLRYAKISQPPPKEVPRRMNVRMTAQG